ncbi:uncharacterized protein LOC110716697 [Chenopodium quinoa]|uniref:uncharacterized protein LOC110716697 n=1 Tax=Chenopodium quinoa TaxID=63459 RepID=UPI000B76C7DA|nr:uncharacterized protein LOC110716697 [Chenopodium quinoa]
MAKDGDTPPPPPPPPPTTEFHPALAVSNIKNAIPLVLDYEKVQYSNWVELFENHACAYNVLDHIDSSISRPTNISDSLWKRLDAIVKQWVYSTIFTDLLNTILAPKSSAQQLWDRIKEIFQDNKNTRAVYLENQFNSLHLSNFPSVTAYCQQLKSLADQLANIEQPVTEQKLVIQLVSGLTGTDFDTVATMIQQTDPLPSFNTARSRLLLEESRRANDHNLYPSSFVAQAELSANSGQQQTQSTAGRGSGGGARGRASGGGKGRGKGKGRGSSSSQGQQQGTQQQGQQQPQGWQQQVQPNPNGQNWATLPQWPNSFQPFWPQGWAIPPAPFPTSGPFQQRPTYARGSSQQAYTMGSSTYGPPMTPTDFGSAYSSMNLSTPDNGWYMDSGATSHMTNNLGSTNGEGNNEMQ